MVIPIRCTQRDWGSPRAAPFGVGVAVQSGFWETLPLWWNLTFLAMLLPMCVIGARFDA
ncbi:MAG TPA: hypothetical protein VIS76_09210 [Pseudomonadales bacterium]